MKTKAIVALAVASVLLTPIVGAKEVTRSDLFESTFSVGYKTRDVGSGVNLDVDWLFSENVGVYGSYNSISGDDIFDTQQQLTAAGLGDIVSETLYPIRFKYDRNYLEYGFSLRHVFYNALETPFAVYAKAGVVKFDYQDMVFLTADGANQESSSGSTDSGSSTTSEPDVEDSVTLEIPSTDAIKGSLGVKFFLNNRTTFDVSYSKYDVSDNAIRPEAEESGVDVEVAYFPRKNFGVSFTYESADITGEPAYNIQATVRW